MSTDNRRLLISILAIAGFGLLMFREMAAPGAIRFCTDDNVGQNALIKSYLPHAFLGFWNDSSLVGSPSFLPTSLTLFLRWIMPARLHTNWTHALFLGTASFFLLLYLRRRGLRWASCVTGALAAFWLGSNFTLVYAGHTSKFGILVFASAFLWLVSKSAEKEAMAWRILAGGALGLTFVEQPDVAFFFALILGPYALFEAWLKFGSDPAGWARFLLPLFAVALAMAVSPLWTGYRTSVRGITAMTQENPADKWNYCTQWSWPPEECIDFIAPGYFGWRTGEPAGPYWGRMGRSAEWEATGQGFQNFKLENQYLGAIPLVLSFFALFIALSRRRAAFALPADDTRRHIIFWGAVAGITLLLSFGKYFPVYALFYRLPIVSSIRNPNKFLQVFQLAIAILAAYGLDVAIRERGSSGEKAAGVAG